MAKDKLKVMCIFGTRPEAIKMVPVIKELEKYPEKIETIVAVTAQHRQMLDQVTGAFEIKVDEDLNMMKNKQSLMDITTGALTGITEILERRKPDLVLVHGDTTTTLAASLASFYLKIPVGHVEAGLRTYAQYHPFPEEINRQLVGRLSTLHFAPTETAKQNLINEGIKDSIYVTGNTAIDVLKYTIKSDYEHPIIDATRGKRSILLTTHRRENVGLAMNRVFRVVKKITEEFPDIHFIYPVHLNPVIKQKAETFFSQNPQVHLMAPLDVTDFHNILARCDLALTDSGGIQEEAPALDVPVLVLRDETERPEGIKAGTIKLVGTDEKVIYEAVARLLENKKAYAQMAQAKNPYGDGEAATRIVDGILNFFNLG